MFEPYKMSEDEARKSDCSLETEVMEPRPKRKQSSGCLPREQNSRLNRRKVKSHSDIICPVCHLTLRSGEIEGHLDAEIKKIEKSFRVMSEKLLHMRRCAASTPSTISTSTLPLSTITTGSANTVGTTHQALNYYGGLNSETSTCREDADDGLAPICSSSGSNESAGVDGERSVRVTHSPVDSLPSTSQTSAFPKSRTKPFKEPGHDLFKRTRINRLLRLQEKRWQVRNLPEEAICPVCQEPVLASTMSELEKHVDKCLRKEEGEEESSEDEEVDVEGDSYEWCGMKRVRITSILKAEGQLRALGTLVEKGDEEANVEVCLLQETEDFGPPQYFEDDLGTSTDACCSSFEDNRLNNVAYSADSEVNSTNAEISEASENFPKTLLNSPVDTSFRRSRELDISTSVPTTSSSDATSFAETAEKSSEAELIESGEESSRIKALRMKIRDLEEKGTFICHICHGPYNKPLVSVACWHVHCENCWMQALSTQKLCPQCKVIVSPSALRKIYL